jgi:hypothetical protein
LPKGVQAYVVAATKGTRTTGLHSQIVGDGLVPLTSALGEHRNPALALHVPRAHRMVRTSANHWDLLSRPEVYQQLTRWLA